MNLSEKIEAFIKEKGLTQKELAKILDMNYTVMNRNIVANKLTIDFILAMSRTYPELDLNWLIKDDYIPYVTAEPIARYETARPDDIINQMQKMLNKLKEDISDAPSK